MKDAAEAGTHRFVWDLRYPLPNGVRDSAWHPRTVLAVPGNYTVRLNVGGKSLTQPLAVVLDPRVNTPQQALVEQFGLASTLSTRLGEASAAYQQFSVLEEQTEERKKAASGNPGLEKLVGEFQKKWPFVEAAETREEFMRLGLSLPQTHPELLLRVVSALGALISYIESADAEPTVDMKKASEAWLAAADGALARWQQFIRDDLAAVNDQLEKAHQKQLAMTDDTPTAPHE